MNTRQPGLDLLLGSDQVTSSTRRALVERLGDLPSTAAVFTPAELARLELVSRHLVPHDPAQWPLARQIAGRLARGEADGWRYDRLPPDAEAYRQLLASLPERFETTDDSGRIAALTAAQEKHPLIFEELLGELTGLYYAQPLAQLAIGYVGFADAHGWTGIGLGQLDLNERKALELAGQVPLDVPVSKL